MTRNIEISVRFSLLAILLFVSFSAVFSQPAPTNYPVRIDDHLTITEVFVQKKNGDNWQDLIRTDKYEMNHIYRLRIRFKNSYMLPNRPSDYFSPRSNYQAITSISYDLSIASALFKNKENKFDLNKISVKVTEVGDPSFVQKDRALNKILKRGYSIWHTSPEYKWMGPPSPIYWNQMQLHNIRYRYIDRSPNNKLVLTPK